MRASFGRRCRVAMLIAAAASIAGVLAFQGGGAQAAGSGGNLRAVRVDAKLRNDLAASPTGGVTAIVTTWNREGLDSVLNVVSGTKLKTLPMVITSSLTSAQLAQLESSPAVRSVWAEHKYSTYMEDSTWITKARYVWGSNPSGADAAHQGFGITGRGVELAVIDTGIDGKHEDTDNLIEFCDTTNASAATADRFYAQCTPWDPTLNIAPAGPCGFIAPTTSNTGPGPTIFPGCRNKARGDSSDPDVSHGTHVSGTIAGTGDASGGRAFAHSTIGMSPDAKLRVYSANVGPSLLNTQTLTAYDDMTYKKEIGYSKVLAVNNSWGGGDGANYDSSDPTAVAVKRAYDAGIVSVFAAGNSGPEHNTLSAQCVIPYVVCVAASTKPDSVVMFSSRGRPSQPSDTNRDGVIDSADIQPDNHDRLLGQKLGLGLYRPTLTAPGVNINSIRAVAADIGDPSAAACYEDVPQALGRRNCYVAANGTSMATPHVTGAIGLIGQALLQRNPNRNLRSSTLSAQIVDILERSANTAKLPAWESEEQGAGRLDVHQAVRYALGQINLNRPNFGYPTPPYAAKQYPGSPNGDPSRFYNEDGCTTPASWSASINNPVDAVQQPPLTPPTLGYGQHFINVPPNTDRLRITATWLPQDNFYLRLWRPGVDPDNEAVTPDYPARTPAFFQSRVWPDQEAVGLVYTDSSRWIEVRAPEEANPGARTQRPIPGEGSPKPAPNDPVPALPSGTWILRVYHRDGTVLTNADPLCAGTAENPKRVGTRYHLKVEMPQVTYRPSVKIDSPANDSFHPERFVDIAGRAGYPPHTQKAPGVPETTAPPFGNVGYSWEGITNWAVPGSGGSAGGGPAVPTVTLYMHGKSDLHPTEDAVGCTGNGETDVGTCNGPFLMPKTTLSTTGSAFWRTGIDDELFDGTNDRNIHDPNWAWCLSGAPTAPGCPSDPGYTPPGTQTISGPMTVEWWASCNLCDASLGISADWIIRVWGDGVLKSEQRVTATPAAPVTPSRLTATVTLPTFVATQRVVVQIDPVYIDSETVATIYYDSAGPGTCTAALTGPATGYCDSLVRMPATTGTGGGGTQPQPPATPQNVRVTDLPANPPLSHPYPTNPPLSPALRVAWDPNTTAPTRYEVYRSTDPLFPGGGTLVYSGPGVACTSPQAPTPNQPPGSDRAGRCYTDSSVSFLVTYYYRVVAAQTSGTSTLRSPNSEIAYGAPTRFDRQIKLKVDRLYGPQYWEYALLPPSPTPNDTTNTGINWKYVWDTLGLVNGTYAGFPGPFALVPGPHLLFARSFTQGIGSTKDGRALKLDTNPTGGGGGGHECGDDDDDDVEMHGPSEGHRGDTATYTMTYHNSSHDDDDDNCEVRHKMPRDMDYESSSNGGHYDRDSHTVSWQTGSVAPGGTYTVTVTGKISSSASVGAVLTSLGYLAQAGPAVSPQASVATVVR
jgi:subtilisin family serine protease